MHIQFPSSSPVLAAARLAVAASWSLNQLLTAEVIGPGRENSTLLNIEGRLVAARSAVPLAAGQRLLVQVTGLEPQPTLKVLPQSVESPALALARGLARALPQQASPTQTLRLVDALQTLSTQAGAPDNDGAPDTMRELAPPAAEVLRRLPTASVLLDATALRAAVTDAGTPNEARLHESVTTGRHDAPPASDLRGALGHIREHLGEIAARRQWPESASLPGPRGAQMPERELRVDAGATLPADEPGALTSKLASSPRDLLELVDQVLARLQSQHLQNAAGSTAGTTHFVVDVPMQHGAHAELLRFEYEGESTTRDSHESPQRAQVVISLLLDDGHEFTARVRLHDGVLGIRLGADEATFNAALADRQDELRARLQAQGLDVGELVIGRLEVDRRPRHAGPALVDARV